MTESTQAGELISGLANGPRLTSAELSQMAMSDQMDLLGEQLKMLAGEIAFSTSTLKRLIEQSASDPDASRTQIRNLELKIQEKKRQMRVIEQRIVENDEASIGNTSLIDMQQILMTQCNEQSFELEIKSADNRILQEQLQDKVHHPQTIELEVAGWMDIQT